MRRRVINTTKVLSVAFALLPTACTKPEAHADPTPLATAAASNTTTTAPVAHPVPSNPDPALVNLAGELGVSSRTDALAKMDHFRPLCDASGYPLVGNLASKGMPDQQPFMPSEFCSEVRKKQTR